MAKIELGDIVALASHPYDRNITSVIIAGEPSFISPLMVVIEIINDTKIQFNEKTGDEISIKGNANCKCIWYSNKSHQFEENWIYSKDLKIIQKQAKLKPSDLYNVIEINSQGIPVKTSEPESNIKENLIKTSDTIKIKNYLNVTLKTSMLELGKIKSTISTTSNLSDGAIEKTTNNSLLSFVSPVLQVTQIIEVKTQEQKEPIYDARTGTKKRIQSECLVKCKWFNANSDKISEKLLPIDALQIIPHVSLKTLKDLKSKIKAYAKFNNTVLQLKGLSFLNGLYYIKAYDYVTNKNIEIEVSKNYDQLTFIKKEEFILKEAPKFNFTDGEVLTKEFFTNQYIKLIQEANSENNKYYLRIKYKNRNDKVSTRTLKGTNNSYSISNVGDINKPLAYLTALCISKDAERTFNINQIQQMQMLYLKF